MKVPKRKGKGSYSRIEAEEGGGKPSLSFCEILLLTEEEVDPPPHYKICAIVKIASFANLEASYISDRAFRKTADFYNSASVFGCIILLRLRESETSRACTTDKA